MSSIKVINPQQTHTETTKSTFIIVFLIDIENNQKHIITMARPLVMMLSRSLENFFEHFFAKVIFLLVLA